MTFTIRPGSDKDLPEMLRLWREMMDFHARLEPRFRPLPSPAGEQAWEKFLRNDIWENENWRVFVAEVDGRLIGQIIGALHDNVPVFEPGQYGYVTDIVVAPDARSGGAGRALFEALKAWFRERGVSHLQLQVAHKNHVSRAFWRTMGCTDYMNTLWYDLEAE